MSVLTTVKQARVPLVLRVFLVLTVLLAVNFYLALSSGEQSHRQAVQTLGTDATSGIVSSAQITNGLEEMQLLAEQIVSNHDPARQQALVQAYDAKRREVGDSIELASERVAFGNAQKVPITNMTYVLGYYQKDFLDMLAAHDKGDDKTALTLYNAANDLMSKNLLPQSGMLDKAGTYALNQSYGDQLAASGSTAKRVFFSGALLVVLLLATQIYTARQFRRNFNLAMLGATTATVVWIGYSMIQFSTIQTHLVGGIDHAFTSVHTLARAKAVAFELRRDELGMQIDPAHAADYRRAFIDTGRRELALPQGTAITQVASGNLPDSASGYLAGALRNLTYHDQGEDKSAYATVAAFGRYVTAVVDPRNAAGDALTPTSTASGVHPQAFVQLVGSIDTTSQIDQTQFDSETAVASSALTGLFAGNILIAFGVVLLVYLGLSSRLREYRSA